MSRPLEWCTTESRRLRHLSDQLGADRHAPYRDGRGGPTLCGQSGRDEARANAARKVYDDNGSTWSMVPPKKRVILADLPECRSCLRSAGTRPVPGDPDYSAAAAGDAA